MSRMRLVSLALGLALLAVAGVELGLDGSPAVGRARVAATAPTPPQRLVGHLMGPRPGAVLPETTVGAADLFTDRVFADASTGFALANDGSAQYPVRTTNAGRDWRINGPQLHVDAADGAEGVGYVGLSSPHTYFAYGSSVVDVTTDSGRRWWETYLGELVVAVVPGAGDRLVAYVQQQLTNNSIQRAATWQYVSTDGGRHWRYTTALGALDG